MKLQEKNNDKQNILTGWCTTLMWNGRPQRIHNTKEREILMWTTVVAYILFLIFLIYIFDEGLGNLLFKCYVIENCILLCCRSRS